MLHDGIHEGIISETDWELAHQKRVKTGVKYEKTHSLNHEHILSGVLKCPLCGSGMYGNVNRKKKKDGTFYKDYFYYACKHRQLVDEHKLYDKFTDLEKKEFLNSFVERVDIYEQEQPDGRFLKHIKFRFPVYFGDRETKELRWDNESTFETVCLLSKKPNKLKVSAISVEKWMRVSVSAE